MYHAVCAYVSTGAIVDVYDRTQYAVLGVDDATLCAEDGAVLRSEDVRAPIVPRCARAVGERRIDESSWV
jgi:hypothetical protein